MGFVLSKLQKEKSKSTEAALEALQAQIKALEVRKISVEEQKRRLVTKFVAIAAGLYVLFLALGYFFYYPSTVLQMMVCLVPLLLIPILIVLLRRLLMWYFEGKLSKNAEKLAKLRDAKRAILEQVMCQETFKVAVDLLERFDDKKEFNPERVAAFVKKEELKQSVGAAVSPVGGAVSPVGAALSSVGAALSPVGAALSPVGAAVSPVLKLRRPTPFPIVDDRSRGAMARFLDFIVGDGPQNRYGMICKECYTHNGMLPKEEYEFASFWCAACSALNPARKVRPVAPLLQQDSPDSPDLTSDISEIYD